MEVWEDVVGYEGRYKVSSYGRMMAEAHPRRSYKVMLSVRPDHHGYPIVDLYNNEGCKRRRVHQLVMKAFRGDTPEGQEIRHLDDIKINCRLDNLCFGTRSDNLRDLYRNRPANRHLWSAGRTRICDAVRQRKINEALNKR